MSRKAIRDPGGAVLTVKEHDYHLVQPFPRIGTRLDALPRLSVRDDDVLIVGYPKSGNHWVWELCCRILKNNTDVFSDNMSKYLLELNDNVHLDASASPRVLVSHLIPRIITKNKSLFNGRHKIIYVLRNPKDVAVSFYTQTYNLRNLYGYDGVWQDYFELFLTGQVDSGSWFDHVLSWENFHSDSPDVPIHFVFYEDLSKNLIGEIRKLSTFLGVSRDEYVIQKLMNVCQFQHMKKTHDAHAPGVVKTNYRHGQITMFRKGIVGDWRNTFTEDQSNRLDGVLMEKMKHSHLKIQFMCAPSKL